MAEKNKNVIFRRVRGRIIPIKVKKALRSPKQRKQVVNGLSMFAGGLGVSFGASAIAGKILRSAQSQVTSINKKVSQAKFAMSGPNSAASSGIAQMFLRSAGRDRKVAVRKIKVSKFFLKGGAAALGGAISSVGIERAFEGFTGRELTAKEEIATNIAGASTSAAVVTGFKSGFGRRLLRRIVTKGK